MYLFTVPILLVQFHLLHSMRTHNVRNQAFGTRKWTAKMHSSISTETDVEAIEASVPRVVPSVFMQLSIPRDRLILVNDLAGISAMADIFKSSLYPIIGVDCEWEPENYYTRSRNKPADDNNNDIEMDDNDQDNAIEPNSSSSSSTIAANTTINAVDPVATARYQCLIDQLTNTDDPSSSQTTSNIAKQSTQNKKKNDKKSSKPSTPVQLVQIATHDYIFLIDMASLCRQPGPGQGHTLLENTSSSLPTVRDSHIDDRHSAQSINNAGLTATESMLNEFFHHLFSNTQMMKVGMGPQTDFKRLYWSYPWLSSLSYINGALDIKTLAKVALPTVSKRDLEGLSKLCIRFLEGIALNKSQQISPWQIRPLTEEQMIYAGLDAWALVQLYDAVIRLLKEDYDENKVCVSSDAGTGGTADDSTVVTRNKKKRNKLVETVEDSLRKTAKQYHLTLPVPYQDFMVVPDSDSIGMDEMRGISGIDMTVGVSSQSFMPLRAIRMEEKNMPKHWWYQYNPPIRCSINTLPL